MRARTSPCIAVSIFLPYAPEMSAHADRFAQLVAHLLQGSREFYGERLISFCLYGSVARGTMHAGSDIDFLLVAEPLPRGRMNRVDEFMVIEDRLAPLVKEAWSNEVFVEFSPLIKTREEVRHGSLLFLDMIDDGKLLYDRDHFMADELAAFKGRLNRLGARRIWRGSTWHWDLKPDYKPGEVFEL